MKRPILSWFRLIRRKLHPWLYFAAALWGMIRTQGSTTVEQTREQTRLLIAFAKLNHLGFVSLLNDCLW